MAAAAPPLEPPGMRPGSSGFSAAPKLRLAVVTPQANSCVLVLPIGIAPSATSAATISASASGTWPRKAAEP